MNSLRLAWPFNSSTEWFHRVFYFFLFQQLKCIILWSCLYNMLWQVWCNSYIPVFFVVCFQNRLSLCINPDCPGTCNIDQTGLQLTKISLCLPPECCDNRCWPLHPAIFLYFWDRVSQPTLVLNSLCVWGWSWAPGPPTSSSWVPRLQTCTTIPVLCSVENWT